MDDVVCNGSETSIKDCQYSQEDDCGINEGAGVECTMKERGKIFIKCCKTISG